jgi:hypothetical protein
MRKVREYGCSCAMKMYGRVKVEEYAFITSALIGNE